MNETHVLCGEGSGLDGEPVAAQAICQSTDGPELTTAAEGADDSSPVNETVSVWRWEPITSDGELDVPKPTDCPELIVALRLLASLRKAGSRGVYRRDVNYFMTWWQDEYAPVQLVRDAGQPRTPIEARREDLEHYLNHLKNLENEPSAATINRRIAVVSSFYERAWDDDDLPVESNPASRLKRPKIDNDARTGLDRQEAGQLLAASRAWPDQTEGTLVLVLLLVGLRVSEAVNLRRSDLVHDGGLLKLSPKRKGVDGRKFLVVDEPDLIKRLQLLGARNDQVFPGIDRFAAGRIVAKIGAAAGLSQPLFPHLLRHTFVSELIRDGVNLETVRSLAGHSSIETTQRYAKAIALEETPVSGRLSARFADVLGETPGI